MPSFCQRLVGAVIAPLALLTACAAPPVPVTPRPPVVAPGPPVTAPPAAASPASEAARRAYAQVQVNLLAQGLLRTDGGTADAPYTDRMLAENFVRVALYDEYVRTSAGLVAGPTASSLRRWQQPVRVALRFGASVPPERRATDTARIASYLARLAQVTGHPIGLAKGAGANFTVHIVSEDERRALGPVIAASLPGLSATEIAGITNMPRSTYCLVYAQSSATGSVYTGALAVIRAEHPDLMRLSCLHEEIAQGLGLANDSPTARPSIFNDDEEFALLTPMDEALLRMLYDPRLRPGMTEAEARPVIDAIAAEMTGEGS